MEVCVLDYNKDIERRGSVLRKKVFDNIVETQLQTCKEVLVGKAEEYATEDRLHNFRAAAALTGQTMEQTLAGMMLKHTVSIYDMCGGSERAAEGYSMEMWDEKITDHINYLILLRAIVEDREYNKKDNSESQQKQTL